MRISLTVPVYNEREALTPLFEKVQRVMRAQYGNDWEIIFVNDGSHDGSETSASMTADITASRTS